MHKKLASDLTSLAHSILQMKNKEDVLQLKEKAYEVYEKLSVLAYVEEYINTTPNSKVTKEELLKKVEEGAQRKEALNSGDVKTNNEETLVQKQKSNEPVKQTDTSNTEVKKAETTEKENTVNIPSNQSEKIDLSEKEEQPKNITPAKVEKTDSPKPPTKEQVEEIVEQPFDELESLLFEDTKDVKNDVKDIADKKTKTLEDELEDTLPVDVMANLFEKAEPKKSLNDHLQNTIQIGLNDRIAFVKHLFEGNQNDFNRVISQLNTFKTEKEAKKFINKLIKPDYDWSDKEEYELRLMEIIERRFN